MSALKLVLPDLESFWRCVCDGESLTLSEQEALLGAAADLLARILVLEERQGGAGHDRRAA